jgi:hypothetical protein
MASLDNFRLVVFRAVAEQHSFRKAAEELYLTQAFGRCYREFFCGSSLPWGLCR